MRLESVRALKAEVSAKSQTDVQAFHATTEAAMPPDTALGIGKRADGEHVLVVRTSDPAIGDALAERAHGEADVKIVTVTKRSTPAYFQGVLRPLEPGAQVAMLDKGFVGTLGCFVRDARGLYALSNSHVVADEGTAQPGHKIGQPFPTRLVGTLTRHVPLSFTAPNLVDAAIVRLDPAIPAITSWTLAINGRIRGVRAVVADDLGRDVFKAGRTTGVQAGKITATEIDGLPVGYDRGTARFNDQIEVSGGPASDFSQPGDSGSVIVTGTGEAIGLLFAGGRDSGGVDRTYANLLTNALAALGVTLA